MFDIDHFKQFNDRYGHFVGDRILCFVTARAMRLVRAGDLVARFGGDEFVVLARETDLSHAMALGERLGKAVAGMDVAAGGAPLSITISIGAAALSEIGPDEPASALLQRVDSRLRAAKGEGRNRVCAVDR
jgi:diguanylate cyclase (GGDEF)-like protein